MNKRRMSGVGLVEIMVALALGLFLLGGLSQIYLSNKRSYNSGEGISRMQENLRFAAEMVAADVRMAGFMPCRKTDKVANVLNSPDTWWSDFFNYGINGYDGDNTDDVTGANDHGQAGIPATTFTNHVAGTDIVVVLRGGESSYSIEWHNAPAASFKINAISDLDKGDIVMVCDLNNSAIVQLTQAHPVNVTIVHSVENGGNPSPGNCTKYLGYPPPVYPSGCGALTGTPYEFGNDSHLVKFTPTAYFIGTNASGGRSLYRATMQNIGGISSMRLDEMVEGIENMQLLYGVDSNGDGYANKYVRADQVIDTTNDDDWNDVVTVRLGLLAQTPTDIALENDTDTYGLAGTSVSPDAADRKQRYQFNTTIKIRNRGAM